MRWDRSAARSSASLDPGVVSAEWKRSPPTEVLSSLAGMKGQNTKRFGRTLYGIKDAAITVAKLADQTFSNFAQEKVSPNKSLYVTGALLSGVGTGKSSFLDQHVSLLSKHCQNEELKELLKPERHPLVLNITLNSGSPYTAAEGIKDSGPISLARRLVHTYTKANWDSVHRAEAAGVTLQPVLALIVDHHRRVCGMAEGQPMVVVVNVDELNQVHARLAAKTPAAVSLADERVQEMASSLRMLSMTGARGVAGVGPAVLCLMAGTASIDFERSVKRSGIEYVSPSLPLLNGAETMLVMEECGVSDKYLSDPTFLQLLEDTGGVPRVLRKVVESLTPEFAENSIAEARHNALEYLEHGHRGLTSEERTALIPYIMLGASAPPMSSPLVKGSPISRTFEDLRMSGAVFLVGDYLTMPMLLLEALLRPTEDAVLANRVVHWYRRMGWEAFEMFVALFHALKMRHLSTQPAQVEVSMGEFYRGARMNPETAALTIKLEKGAKYNVVGKPSDTGTYQFPGGDAAKNKRYVERLAPGAVLLNEKTAPAGDCILVNALAGLEPGVLVRSLCMAHTANMMKLSGQRVDTDHHKAVEAFKQFHELFAEAGPTTVVTVHVSNRELHEDAKSTQDGCIVIGRDEMLQFFGPTFHRGLVSPAYTAALRAGDSVRAYSTASCPAGRGRSCLLRSPRPASALPTHSVTGLRLVRNLARRLL